MNKGKLAGIPEDFFRFALPAIQDADLLKLVMYVLWKADRVGNHGLSFTADEVMLDEIFIHGLSSTHQSKDRLGDLLESAASGGFLIRSEKQETDARYYINCEDGRKMLSKASRKSSTVTLDQVTPNIFKAYEANIGPLTPIIADALREAENLYDNNWIMEAIEIAIKQNARSWRYVETILEHWQKEGRDGTDRKNDQTNYRRYIKG